MMLAKGCKIAIQFFSDIPLSLDPSRGGDTIETDLTVFRSSHRFCWLILYSGLTEETKWHLVTTHTK